MAAGEAITCKILNYKSDQTPFWNLMQLSPIVGAERQITHYAGVLIDITEQKRREAEMEALRHDIAHLSRVAMVNELTAALAHQINQPLTAILSNAQAARILLRNKPADLEQLSEIIEDIVADDKVASSVIHRLRTFIKKGNPADEVLTLNQIVSEIIELTNANLAANGIRLSLELAEDLPSIYGDKVQLQQVVLNLINNACEAMQGIPKNDRHLNIKSFHDGDSYVAVKVSDTGTGIPEKYETKIFKAFFSTKNEGLGLGLSICRSIIEHHGGEMFFESKPDAGCAFGFKLPILNKPGSSHDRTNRRSR